MRSFLQIAGGSAAIVALACFGAAPAQDDPEPNLPDGIEIRTHGPIHEAFAQPAGLQPAPGELAPKEPPPPVPEEPPDERPEGDNVQFIPGYWAWEPDENQFLWVSGGYRNVPAGRQWIAGHWVRSDDGWRWVPGFWAPEQQQELRYTPEPPAPLQVEPNIPAPDDNSTWVAGNWVYRDSRFLWRPGYWSPFRVGRVWVGARYYWTPGGYLYNDGYWDYPWDNCGLLFAPVYFSRPYWHTPGWRWRPWYAVNFGLFYDSCFTRYGSSHFYFGNYYGSRYAGLGYHPWFHGHGRYNPYFGHHRWHHGHGGNWYGQQRQLYADRGAGRAPVPPRNLAQQRQMLASKAALNNNFARAVAPLNQAKTINKNVNLVRMSPAQAATQKALIQRSQDVAKVRSQTFAPKVGGVGAIAPKSGDSLKLPPLVRGTETVRSGAGIRDGDSKKVGSPSLTKSGQGAASSAGGSKKTFSPPGAGTVNAPKVTFPNPGKNTLNPNVGKGPTPNVNKSPIAPMSGAGKGPAPKVNNLTPAPKSGGKGSASNQLNFKSSAPPKTYSPSVLPRISEGNAGKQRALDAPRSAPTPRSFEQPRAAQPAPRFSAPKSSLAPNSNASPRYSAPSSPRYSAPSSPRYSAPSTPRYSAPSTPRYSAPRSSPAPRFSAPSYSPAPRFSAPPSSPAPRFSAPRSSPAPRSAPAPRSGGGGRGRGKG